MAENTFGAVFTRFVEAIHIKLTDEAIDFFVPKISGKDDLLELVDVLDGKVPAIGAPEDYFRVVLVLS